MIRYAWGHAGNYLTIVLEKWRVVASTSRPACSSPMGDSGQCLLSHNTSFAGDVVSLFCSGLPSYPLLLCCLLFTSFKCSFPAFCLSRMHHPSTTASYYHFQHCKHNTSQISIIVFNHSNISVFIYHCRQLDNKENNNYY